MADSLVTDTRSCTKGEKGRQTWFPYRAIYFTSYVLPKIGTLMFYKEIILDCFAKHRKRTKSLGKPVEVILNVINGDI